MKYRFLSVCLLVVAASCHSDKQTPGKPVAATADKPMFDTVAQQKTIDSLLEVYNSFKAIPYSSRERSSVQDLLYTMTRRGISKHSGLNDQQIRINELETQVRLKESDYEEFKSRIDTLKWLAGNIENKPIAFYQLSEFRQEYFKEITVINYKDSAKVILRVFTSDSTSKFKLVGRQENQITQYQWNNLEQKAFTAHFWATQLNEQGIMGDGIVMHIRAGTLDNKNVPVSYNEVGLLMGNGSLEEMLVYAKQLLQNNSRTFDFEIPRHKHHAC